MIISCPHCQQDLKASHEHSGQVVNCPHDGCGEAFEMPEIPPPGGLQSEPLALGGAGYAATSTPEPAPPKQGHVPVVRRAKMGGNFESSRARRDAELRESPEIKSFQFMMRNGAYAARILSLLVIGLVIGGYWSKELRGVTAAWQNRLKTDGTEVFVAVVFSTLGMVWVAYAVLLFALSFGIVRGSKACATLFCAITAVNLAGVGYALWAGVPNVTFFALFIPAGVFVLALGAMIGSWRCPPGYA